MKGLFPQYSPEAKIPFKEIWNEATFVFDTNVLLNSYRYQSQTRDQLLEVLGKLGTRIWIPHHVALEFYRNRLAVIADQNKRFSEVRKAVEKSRDSLRSDLANLQLEQRHSLIDPAPVVKGIEDLANNFLERLAKIQKEQQRVNDEDPLKDRLELLFDGRVGPPPENQDEIDNLYAQAKKRFECEIPPGYMDAQKGKDDADKFSVSGVNYQKRYGDYLVWSQLLDFTKSNDLKTLVFVTDDQKEDWWWKINSDGPKTLGPRPELAEEACRVGGVNSFNMYSVESFLRFSKEHLAADVSDETLEEVRGVSRDRAEGASRLNEMRKFRRSVENAVFTFLTERFDYIEKGKDSFAAFPDFVARSEEGRKFGFDVNVLNNARSVLFKLKDIAYRAHFELSEGRFDMITLVWVLPSDEVDTFVERLKRMKNIRLPGKVRNLVGYFDLDSNSFTPAREFAFSDLVSPGELFDFSVNTDSQ